MPEVDSSKPKPAKRGGQAITIIAPTEAEIKARYEWESKKLPLEYGWISHVIGTKNSSNNIAFVIAILLFLAGFAVLFVFPQDRIEFWKLILPIFTLILGYLFGKRSQD